MSTVLFTTARNRIVNGFSPRLLKSACTESEVQKIAVRRSDRRDNGALGGEMLAEKFSNITVLADEQNISSLDRLAGIKRVGVHLRSSGHFGKCSVPKARVFESEISALRLVKDRIGINDDPPRSSVRNSFTGSEA